MKEAYNNIMREGNDGKVIGFLTMPEFTSLTTASKLQRIRIQKAPSAAGYRLINEILTASESKLRFLRWAMYGKNELTHPIHSFRPDEANLMWEVMKIRQETLSFIPREDISLLNEILSVRPKELRLMWQVSSSLRGLSFTSLLKKLLSIRPTADGYRLIFEILGASEEDIKSRYQYQATLDRVQQLQLETGDHEGLRSLHEATLDQSHPMHKLRIDEKKFVWGVLRRRQGQPVTPIREKLPELDSLLAHLEHPHVRNAIRTAINKQVAKIKTARNGCLTSQ
jgi:hypothetical protein